MITTGHLCSGYDGLGRGLALLAPHTALWHAEVDPDMSTVLAKHEPDVPNVGNLITAPWHFAPTPDIMTAGFPCQPVSGAGAQLAELDPRWLWPFIVKIIRVVGPRAVFLENVQNIVGIQGGAILRGILADLRDAGYAARWTIVGACAVGAPHHRHRWFLWASRVDVGPAPEAVRVGAKAHCGAPGRNGTRVLLPTPMTSDTNGAGRASKLGGDSLNIEDAVALLPTPRASDGPNGGPNQRNGRGEYDALPGLVVNALPEVWGKYAAAVALWEQITGVPAPDPTELNTHGGRRMSALLPEWMMGLPPGLLTGHLPRAAAIKGAGNGVAPLQVAAAQRLLTC